MGFPTATLPVPRQVPSLLSHMLNLFRKYQRGGWRRDFDKPACRVLNTQLSTKTACLALPSSVECQGSQRFGVPRKPVWSHFNLSVEKANLLSATVPFSTFCQLPRKCVTRINEEGHCETLKKRKRRLKYIELYFRRRIYWSLWLTEQLMTPSDLCSVQRRRSQRPKSRLVSAVNVNRTCCIAIVHFHCLPCIVAPAQYNLPVMWTVFPIKARVGCIVNKQHNFPFSLSPFYPSFKLVQFVYYVSFVSNSVKAKRTERKQRNLPFSLTSLICNGHKCRRGPGSHA